MKGAKGNSIIKNIRLKKRITQKELGEKVGLTQQAVALLESGQRKLEFDLFINLLNAMNTTKEELSNAIQNLSDDSINPFIELNSDKFLTLKNMKENQIILNYRLLNEQGQQKAVEQVELLTKIPEYRTDTPD